MTNRELRQQINRLAWPIVASNVLLRGVGIADTIILGHVNKESLAAIGVGQQINFLGMVLAFSLSVGINVVVSYYTGSREIDKRTRIANSSLWISLAFGLVVMVLGQALSVPMARMMGARDEVLRLAWAYLRIIWLFYFFRIYVYNLAAIFQGSGDSRTPMFVILFTNVIHVVVAYAMVHGKYGFAPIGIYGAAWATVLSDGLTAVILFLIAIKRGLIRPSFGGARAADLKKLWDLTTPIIGERLLITSAVLVYSSTVLHFSVAAYAAHQIAVNIEAFSFLPGMAYMQAATILVGQNLGANNVDRAVRSAVQSSLVATGIMSLFGLSFLFFPNFWVSIFTSDPEVAPLGVIVCRVSALCQPPLALAMVFSGALRGAGETRWVMYIAFLGAWVTRITLAMSFAYLFDLGIVAIWSVMIIDWCVRSALFYWRFRKGGWKLARRPEPAQA